MQIIIMKDYDLLVDVVVEEMVLLLKQKPDAVLGLPTGNSPLGIYKKLVELYHKKHLDFSRVRTYNLDEYVDIPADDPASFRYFMQANFFDKVNIPRSNIHFPPSELKNLKQKTFEYEESIQRNGGLDLTLLGIGRNGHIGFNEPTSSLRSLTRIKTLTKETLIANDLTFEGDRYPDLAVTMGIQTIMDSKSVILIASGQQKAEAIKQAVEGPVSAMCPASTLQLHPHVKIIVEEEAARLLTHKYYYKKVYDRTQYVSDRS